MGFGLIKVVGKNMEFLQLNELQLSKYDNHYQRLKIIFERTIELIETHHPDEIAIEAGFNTTTDYYVAASNRSSDVELAQRFADFVVSPLAQEILRKYGFVPAVGGK